MAEVMDQRRSLPPEIEMTSSPSDSPPPPPPPPPRAPPGPPAARRDDFPDPRGATPPLPPPPPLPPAPPRRPEADREKRRRSSPSPPPYRRHSPPRRSPPGPPKRSRREDGGYDRRRGSPRGYDDRRYGYDYERGGDRRFVNRSDWSDSGRGGYGDSSQREGLMSYKQFIQELEDDILPAEAERRYLEYKSEYISTQKRAYFETHKDEDWLKDKYHPTNLVNVIERRKEQARATAKDFLLDLQSGTLDLGPGLTPPPSNKSGHGSEPNSDDELDAGGKRRRHGRGPAKETDMLSAAPKAHPVSADPRRILKDIEHAQALVRKLDAEKGIVDNVLSSSDHDKSEGENSHVGSMGPIIIIRGLATVKGLEGVELLDTLITYLWRIHGIDYYGMTEMTEPKGLRHMRGDTKPTDESALGGTDWEKKLDSHWQDRLLGQDPMEIMTAKEKIDLAAADVLDPHVRKIRDEKYGWKYGCGAKGCTKLFHAAEFVHKHLRLKHPEIVVEVTSKLRQDLYFQNYMNDANAPGGNPIMQQSVPKDRFPRRRSILDNRLKDDRGNRRDTGRAMDEDRYDKTDNSPSREGNGGPEGGNTDEAYDGYGGQGLHGSAPFSSDIPPPPVLMPVPGAGPLGPFVPAPPEVAMRMLREQGGPSPYEGNGGPRSRKGRPGSGPILGMPPPFRQDPRRIRSYQDLDAPEDEVTVIDYRSLS